MKAKISLGLSLIAAGLVGIVSAEAKGKSRSSSQPTDPVQSTEPVQPATPSGSTVTMNDIAVKPADYVGNVVTISGVITKLEKDGLSEDSFIITLDKKLEVRVNIRVMSISSNSRGRGSSHTRICLYNPPMGGSPMICYGTVKPTFAQSSGFSSNKRHSSSSLDAKNDDVHDAIFTIGDAVIVRGSLQQRSSKFVIDAVKFYKNPNVDQ